MYIPTQLQYLYYKFEDQIFKVPTYGKIYKIIDFGRSIFQYNGITYCSDSFCFGEDAYSQYNCEPFFNESKPRLEPNMSFDLCRLDASLFDYFIEDLNEIKTIQPNSIKELVYKWTLDDQNKNVLYRQNGEERYPDFKLYKMISRNVHNKIQKNEIQKEIFQHFKLDFYHEDVIDNIIHI